MKIINTQDILEKNRRVKEYLQRTGNDALLISRQDNFAWYTCGGSNKVVITSEIGCAMLVITTKETFFVAQTMDGPRIMDEELKGTDIQPVFVKWNEMPVAEKALLLVKGMEIVSDVSMNGAKYDNNGIYRLHFPLTETEIKKAEWIGMKTDEILRKVADEIKPGMTDYEIEAMLLYEYGKLGALPEVILVGIDERIANYRHCIPSGKKVGKMVLMHTALKMDGLHANVARTLNFGDNISPEIVKRYDAANMILASIISMCSSGQKFADIHRNVKRWFAEFGYADEWEKHFVGGSTGYMLVDFSVCFDPNAEITSRHSFDWFVTITGAKVEELILCNDKNIEVASITGKWPTKEYNVGNTKIQLPEILIK